MTASNSPTWTDDPGKLRGPARAHVGPPAAGGAPPGPTVPLMFLHYARLRRA